MGLGSARTVRARIVMRWHRHGGHDLPSLVTFQEKGSEALRADGVLL